MSGPGSDLVVEAGLGLPVGLVVPAGELVERFSRSSGPGGQSVNTADSRVQLELDLAASSAFTEPQRARLIEALGPVVAITASEHRSQHRNRMAARERLAALLRETLAPPPPARRPTRPGRGAKERRLQAKRERAGIKSMRGQVRPDD